MSRTPSPLAERLSELRVEPGLDGEPRWKDPTGRYLYTANNLYLLEERLEEQRIQEHVDAGDQ